MARLAAVASLLLASCGLVVSTATPAAADGPTTFSNAAAIAIPATGSTQQTGPASPYPSTIAVSGMAGAVTKVTVSFTNLTHGSLPDVDALVVAPSGENLPVMSDIGPPNTLRFATNATYTFDDAAASGMNAVTTPSVPSGTYRPTNNANADGTTADPFPAPAPTPSTQTTLAGAFTGINPNGTWRLFVVDDATGDLGTMAGGWSLTITTEVAAVATTTTVTSSVNPSQTGAAVTFTATVRAGATAVTAGTVQISSDGTNLGGPVALNASGQAALTTSTLTEGTHLIRATYSGATGFLTSNGTVSQRVDNPTVITGNTFCNTGPLTVPDAGTASPYPSNLTVTGVPGNVTKVTAQLKGVSHTAPIDLDVMLSGPTPSTNVLLMSDAGGQSAVSGLNLTFDDAAPSNVPAPAVSGTFRPTDLDPDGQVDSFPAPAPSPSTASALSTFNGAPGNGQWSLWVVDDASGDAGSISGGWCITVSAAVPTTTTVTSSANPSLVGQLVTFTATVAAGGTPATAGTVTFSDGGTTLGAPVPVAANGSATLTTSALAVGSHPITATYNGTDAFLPSTGSLIQVVTLVPTTTALTSSLNPSHIGDPVTFTATVTAGAAAVTAGSVVFSVDGAAQPPVPVNASGIASFTTSSLPAGTHPVTATYGPTTTYASSTGSLDQIVDLVPTTTTLTAAPNPSRVGDTVLFTATVVAGATPVTAGSVVFTVDGAAQPAQPVDGSGVASLSTSALAAGTHPVTATYGPTATFAASTDSVDQVVDRHVTATTVTSSDSPSVFGQSVTFTATVTADGAPVAAGSVTFTDGATTLGTVPVAADGTATLTTSAGPADALTVGTHTITATFGQTATFASSSGTVTQVVNPVATTTTVTSSLNPSLFGQSVTFTATVTGGAAPVADGTVQFSVDGADAGAPVAVAAGGTATFTTTTLDPGTHTVGASYSGTATLAPSSGTVDQVVNPRAVAAANGPYSVAEGASLTLDGTGSSSGATYEWDVNGDSDFGDATGLRPTLTWEQLEALGIDDGPSSHTVALRVTLGADVAPATATLAVTNTAPTAVLTGALTATVGVPFTIKIGADDPSSADLAADFTYRVDWGDGSPVVTVTGTADPPVTHTYAAAGSFAASFTATDKDGGTGEQTAVTIVASPAATTPPTTSPTATPTTTPTTSPTPAPSGTSGGEEAGSGVSGSGGLPETGADATGPALAGGGLLALGLALLVLARRLRREP